MNIIEMHEKIAEHLTKQKAPSVGRFMTNSGEDDFGCAYRGDQGRMCAVGCLIPDEDYNSSMEKKAVHFIAEGLWFKNVFGELGDPEKDRVVLAMAEWQSYHDAGQYDLWCEDRTEEVDCMSPTEYKDKLIEQGYV